VLDPFIILTALPARLRHPVDALRDTDHLNVPSIWFDHAVGVATANSILLVTFANDERVVARIRSKPLFQRCHAPASGPYDALAMIIGMLPMALSLGEGGEQKRAGPCVIGGLIFATFSTLFFVPMFIVSCARAARRSGRSNRDGSQC